MTQINLFTKQKLKRINEEDFMYQISEITYKPIAIKKCSIIVGIY